MKDADYTEYNGDLYDFEEIVVVSAGARDADSEGLEGMSASKMRKAAADNDFKAFAKGIPNIGNVEKKQLFNTLQKSMGITVSDPDRLDIRGQVEAGKDCSIDVNVIIYGDVKLGDNVSIGPNCIIKDTLIESNTKIEAFSHIDKAHIGESCVIGPYARLREGSKIESSAKVGNFVETKNSVLGEGSKANHFTYLGDTEVGKDSNIGAGTITCNYDGKDKHKTTIGDESFIGSNTALVAPVTVGSNATVAAGSVITKDVPDNALGLGRSKQSNKDNWSKKKD